ncbi:MAG: pentapeptide repeat-containing protein, partial [Limnothrix sp.]
YSSLVNLQGLNLSGFDLTNANFSGSDLSNSNLSGANLADANLITANLNDSDLKDADLSRAKLVQTQLDNADLTGANLTGACIEDWGVTVYTVLNGIYCDYVYMRFIDGDKRHRKPDSENVNFAEGEFVEFIKPLVDTLDLYHVQVKDPRLISIAIQEFQENNPNLNFDIISIERRGKELEDILLRLKMWGEADVNRLHSEYLDIYSALQTLPFGKINKEIGSLFKKVMENAEQSVTNNFYDTENVNQFFETQTAIMGDQVMGNKEDRSISVGGNAGIVGGGDVKDINFQGTMNLGEISGNVTNTINQLPDSPDPDKPNIKELLSQLQAAINAENELGTDDKADALEQIRTFAEAAQNPSDSGNQKLAKTASRVLKGILAEMPTFTAAAKQIKEYLPLILTFFGI